MLSYSKYLRNSLLILPIPVVLVNICRTAQPQQGKCPAEVQEEAKDRVKALLECFVLYSEIDLDYLKS